MVLSRCTHSVQATHSVSTHRRLAVCFHRRIWCCLSSHAHERQVSSWTADTRQLDVPLSAKESSFTTVRHLCVCICIACSLVTALNISGVGAQSLCAEFKEFVTSTTKINFPTLYAACAGKVNEHPFVEPDFVRYSQDAFIERCMAGDEVPGAHFLPDKVKIANLRSEFNLQNRLLEVVAPSIITAATAAKKTYDVCFCSPSLRLLSPHLFPLRLFSPPLYSLRLFSTLVFTPLIVTPSLSLQRHCHQYHSQWGSAKSAAFAPQRNPRSCLGAAVRGTFNGSIQRLTTYRYRSVGARAEKTGRMGMESFGP